MSMFSRFSTKSASSSVASADKGEPAIPPTSKIFTTPPEGVVPKKKWEYNEAQLAQIAELKEYTSTLLLPESDPYHPWEARFLADPGCHPRYMRAAKWKMPDAKNRIKGTMEWRREYKPELIEPEDVGVEAETGKIILTGFDVDARPILYMRPGRENTKTSPRQIQHLIFHLERAIDLMPPGQEQVAIIVDYKSATSQSNPSISTAGKVLNILQNHYVERLGRGLVVNMSWWINAFFSGITPFMDPITRDKIRFNPKLEELVPVAQLDKEFGGQYNFEFEHDEYWRTLVEFCHIAKDGSRVNSAGEKWYPPLGNGIKAAVDGLVPVKGATQTGEVAPIDSDKADKSVLIGVAGTAGAAAVGSSGPSKTEEQTAAERIASDARASSAAGNDKSDDETLADGMHGATIADAADGAVGGPAAADGPGAVAEVHAAATKAGEPVGEVVFDHPPSKDEVKQALKAEA